MPESYLKDKRDWQDIKRFDSVIIYGAGGYCTETVSFLEKREIKIDCIIDRDSNKWGRNIAGYKVCGLDILEKFRGKSQAVVFSIVSFQNEIAERLISEYHIPESCIFSFTTEFSNKYMYGADKIEKHSADIEDIMRILADDESRICYEQCLKSKVTRNPVYITPNPNMKSPYSYFLKDGTGWIRPEREDCIVDCGAYIGDTAQLFCEMTDNMCRVICIEASQNNYDKMNDILSEKNMGAQVEAKHLALGSSQGRLILFSEKEISVNASLDKGVLKGDNGEEVEVDTLDNICGECDKIDFIKMDIEGAEIDALKGGRGIIQKYRPNLCISAYHRTEHLWEIPYLIRDICSDYKIYFGHQMNAPFEPEFYCRAR